MRNFDELNMKKFNPQIIFFHFLCLSVFLFASSCRQNIGFTTLSGEQIKLSDSTIVFVFLNVECPICQKYQGDFKSIHQLNDKILVYYVFPGQQKKEDILRFCSYDSMTSKSIVSDSDFILSKSLGALITPQAIVLKNQKTVYAGKIDDRFLNLGASKPKAGINYVNNALFSLSRNEDVRIKQTEPVGCFIEPR